MVSAFGSLIRKKRTALGMSVSELARRSGLSRSYISLIEYGKRTTYSRETVRRLAKVLSLRDADLDMALIEPFGGKKWAVSRDAVDISPEES